jgi:hypothetical protein
MNATMKYMLAAGAAALFATAMAASAEADYLGYANGDPANWDFYQEQHNGASPLEAATAPAARYYVSPHHPRTEYNERMYHRHDAIRAPREY